MWLYQWDQFWTDGKWGVFLGFLPYHLLVDCIHKDQWNNFWRDSPCVPSHQSWIRGKLAVLHNDCIEHSHEVLMVVRAKCDNPDHERPSAWQFVELCYPSHIANNFLSISDLSLSCPLAIYDICLAPSSSHHFQPEIVSRNIVPHFYGGHRHMM